MSDCGGAVRLPRSRWASGESGEGGGVTGYRHSQHLLPSHSATEPGVGGTEQQGFEQSHTENQPLRSCDGCSGPPWATFQRFELLLPPLRRNSGVTVKVLKYRNYPSAGSMKKNQSGKRVSPDRTDTGRLLRPASDVNRSLRNKRISLNLYSEGNNNR